MPIKYCPNCGAPVTPNTQYCSQCGTPISVQQQSNPKPKVSKNNNFQQQSTEIEFSVDWYRNNIMTTQGRLSRSTYFKYVLLNTAIMFVVYFVMMLFAEILGRSSFVTLLALVAIVISIPIIIGGFMLGIRRLHDFNQSGWLMLICFIPYINIIFGFVMLFVPGTNGANKYGNSSL